MKRAIYAALAATLTCIGADAQTLTTEVVVDRTVLPAERAANRPEGVVPRLVLPGRQSVDLSTADYTTLSELTRGYTALSPAEAPCPPYLSPYRGYAALAYGPMYNLGMSIGYRAIDSERTRLSIHGQFDGESYKADGERWRYNGGTVGADLNMRVGERSHLLASVDGGYSQSGLPWQTSRSLGLGGLQARWLSSAGPVAYTVGIEGSIDSYGACNVGATRIESMSLGQYGVVAGGAYAISRTSRAGLDFDAKFARQGACGPLEARTLGVVTFTPYYAVDNGRTSLRAGVAIDLETGEETKARVAPKVYFANELSGRVALYANVTGGSALNTYSTLRNVSPYYVPVYGNVGHTDVPVDAEVGLNIGSINGFDACVRAGYSIANDVLTTAGVVTDMKGWRVGVGLGYTWGRILRAEADAALAQGGSGHGYYMWRDEARCVIGGRVEATPVERVKVGATYRWRSYPHSAVLRGPVSDLGVSAAYAVSDAISVFVRGENLLDRRRQPVATAVSQGIHALVGAEIKF